MRPQLLLDNLDSCAQLFLQTHELFACRFDAIVAQLLPVRLQLDRKLVCRGRSVSKTRGIEPGKL